MATYPVYPATTFTQAVELTIFASNQLHDVINGDALTTVETENGDIPTLRKALVDNFYFKTPITWVEGESSTVFNQLYYFDGTLATSGWYYAPQATLDNPIAMGSTPLDDDNWRLYQTATQSIPAQVYPWSVEITEASESVSPPYEFDTAIVILNGVVLTPTRDYTISNNKINFTSTITPEPGAEVPDILFCYIGKVQEGNPNTNYVTYTSLASSAAAAIIGTESGNTLQEELDSLNSFVEKTNLLKPQLDKILNPPVAAIKFGDDDKSAQLDVSPRGVLSVSVNTNGLPIAEKVHVPFSESTGYYKGPFPDTIVKFPTSDEPDDFKSHGVLLSYDEKRSRPRFFLLNPYSTSQHGYVTSKRTWGNPLLPEMADLNSIGKSLSNSYDQYFTLDSTNKNYFKLASISNSSNAPGAFLSCLITIGDYTNKKRAVYSLNVQTPDYTTALNVNTILDLVKLTCIEGSNTLTTVASTTTPTTNTLVAGLVKTATGFDVWLSLPAHSTYFSCTVLNSGSEDLVTFDWSRLKSDSGLSSLAGSPTAGTVWAPVDSNYDSRRVVPLNDGSLFYVPVGYMMLRLHANGTTVGIDPRFQWISAFCRRSVLDSATSTVSTINCTISSHVFTITGCDLATDQPVYISKPKSVSNQGDLRVVVSDVDTVNHSFKVTVTQKTTTATTTATTDAGVTTYNTVLADSFTPIDPPSDTWVDVLIKLV